MRDVPEFIRKAQDTYGYKHFINDAGGSICELDDAEVIRILDEHTLILYTQASATDDQELIRRAKEDPKPLYYREAFLDEHLAIYMSENNLPYVAMIDPDDFVRWIFPPVLFAFRVMKRSQRHGYAIATDELGAVYLLKFLF